MCAPNPDSCGGTGGCFGATAEIAFEYVTNSIGMMEEYQYPYLSYYGMYLRAYFLYYVPIFCILCLFSVLYAYFLYYLPIFCTMCLFYVFCAYFMYYVPIFCTM